MLLSKLIDAFVDAVGPVLARLAPPQPRWVAVMEPDGLAHYEVRRGRATLVARPGATAPGDHRWAERARRAAVELRLPPDRILRRTLRLPQAGREFVGQIVEHRLPRLTPWNPGKVLYGFRIAGEAGPDGLMEVEFAATSEDLAAEAVDLLKEAGLEPSALGAASEPIEAPLRLDLYRGARGTARPRMRRTIVLSLAAIALLLVPTGLLSFWQVHAAGERLEAVETRLIRARARLQAVAGGGEGGPDRALLEAKRPERSVLVLMDRLSAAIPSTTFLRELEIGADTVRLVGHSADAPALIGLLEADEALAKVRFAAPVTRDGEDRDGFDIVAVRVGPEGAP